MSSNFWSPTNYSSTNDHEQETAESVSSSFSNHLRSLEFNAYDAGVMFGSQSEAANAAATGHGQIPSNATLTQAISPSSADVHYRVASIGHTPNHALYQPAHLGANTSPPGFALSSNLSNSSSPFPLLHNPTLYAPSHDVSSYNIAHTTTSAAAASASYHTFPSQSTFEHRGHLGLSPPSHSGMPPPPPPSHQRNAPLFPASPPLMPIAALRQEYSPTSYHSSRQLQSSVNPFQLTTPSPVSQSPPLTFAPRPVDQGADRRGSQSGSSFGYGDLDPLHAENPHIAMSGRDVPPFDATTEIVQLFDNDGQHVSQEIHAKIDKGFQRQDSEWFCYRRNYFSVVCSYSLTSSRGEVDHQNVYLMQEGHREVIHGFYACIAAIVEGEDGRAIELVQHTAKRDKGPINEPGKRLLRPNPTGNLHPYAGASSFDSLRQSIRESNDADFEDTYPEPYQPSNQQEVPSIAVYDRIQFKKATANNGKRRAAQQYFHIVVELYAKVRRVIGSSGGFVEDFVKVSQRVSEQMVVRGRSPGHYADGKRGSSSRGGGSGSSSGGGRGYNSMARDLGPPDTGMDSDAGGVLPGQYLHRGGTGHSAYHHHPQSPNVAALYGALSLSITATSPVVASSFDRVFSDQQRSQRSTSTFSANNSASIRCRDDESQTRHYHGGRNMSRKPTATPYPSLDLWYPDSQGLLPSRRSMRQYSQQDGMSPTQIFLIST